jgi:hypothetical protein
MRRGEVLARVSRVRPAIAGNSEDAARFKAVIESLRGTLAGQCGTQNERKREQGAICMPLIPFLLFVVYHPRFLDLLDC